ncbi:unnamed protein product [Pipistrellus nathusii]|uniref:Secreted protein n=1 Tax=Pipistrellus nathusii TaxID=59473 RepID=A0ABN9Z6S3_PIPNA
MKGSIINMLISLSFLLANKPWDHLLPRLIGELKHCTQAHTLNKQHFRTKNSMFHDCTCYVPLLSTPPVPFRQIGFALENVIHPFRRPPFHLGTGGTKVVAIWEDI